MALPVLLRAALPSLPVLGSLPGVRKAPLAGFTGLARETGPVRISRAHVDAYARVCGFPVKDVVPLPYPHLLGFDAQMAIMADPAFPAPAIGTVHVDNVITAHRPLQVGRTEGEEVRVTVRVGAPLPHPKGTAFAFVTEVRDAAGDLVWDEVSTYLRRGTGDPGAPAGTAYEQVPPGPARWRLPGDLGRRYAAVSGDRNPIHLYPLTARALGFPRQIAHGMWTMARCVAALENRLPDAARVAVAFRKPVLLPGTVAFGSRAVDHGWAFSLSSPTSGEPHLAGAVTPAG